MSPYRRSSLDYLGLFLLGSLPIGWIVFEYFSGNKSVADPIAITMLISLWIGGLIFVVYSFFRSAADSERNVNAELLVLSNMERRIWRRRFAIYCLAGAGIFFFFPASTTFNGIPIRWISVLLVALAVLPLFRVNVFYGGPLDYRLDTEPRKERSKRMAGTTAEQVVPPKSDRAGG